MVRRLGRVRIATSGWLYRHWRGSFYPDDLPMTRWFAYYRERFDTVELNAPFYHLPKRPAVERWYADSHPDFLYAVKGSRFITHNKKLAEPREPLARMFGVLEHLREKLGVVLFQLPPTWGVNVTRLEGFLAAFRRRAGSQRVCFEFRNPQWYSPEVATVLDGHGAGFCIYHLDGHTSPLTVTGDFAYLRLHGTDGAYAGAYGAAGLRPWVQRIRSWQARGLDVFCYFDNDVGGHAPRDAEMLRQLLAG